MAKKVQTTAQKQDDITRLLACYTMLDKPQSFVTIDQKKVRKWVPLFKWLPLIGRFRITSVAKQKEWLIKKPTMEKQVLLEALFIELGVDWDKFTDKDDLNKEIGHIIATKGYLPAKILAYAVTNDPDELHDEKLIKERTMYFHRVCTLSDLCLAMSVMYLYCDKMAFLNCMRFATMLQLSKPSPEKGMTRRIQ